ncbi:MAG: hypothetical protein E3K33_12500 [Candidatus Brocadia sp.]|nr:hypothetical protein [Candidatus Brocadia fulgida]MDG5997743.1 hypothetical protein [Candidatus Brocadia sp.]
MNFKRKTCVALALGTLVMGITAVTAMGQQIRYSSAAGKVAAVTNPSGHTLTTRFQLDTPNLQRLLSTRIYTGRGCIIAHLSGLARITDNYVVFQVRMDGVPMRGHTTLLDVPTPVVYCKTDALSSPPYDDEQYIDPTKVCSYNLFDRVLPGTHTVEVMGAAGSNIISGNEPSVNALVLTLEYP